MVLFLVARRCFISTLPVCSTYIYSVCFCCVGFIFWCILVAGPRSIPLGIAGSASRLSVFSILFQIRGGSLRGSRDLERDFLREILAAGPRPISSGIAGSAARFSVFSLLFQIRGRSLRGSRDLERYFLREILAAGPRSICCEGKGRSGTPWADGLTNIYIQDFIKITLKQPAEREKHHAHIQDFIK